MKLTSLAQSLANHLGPEYYLREDYAFAVPEQEVVSERTAEAVIFSSPIPSIQSAAVGFTAKLQAAQPEQLSKYAYLGAPLLISHSDDSLALYEFRGTPVAEKIESRKISDDPSADWLRKRVVDSVDQNQLKFVFGSGKDLLIQDTRTALSSRVAELMKIVDEEKQLPEVEAFKVAMSVIRRLSLGHNGSPGLPTALRQYARELATRIQNTVSFANVPPESIAELYEAFAVHDHSRRRRGVVYTPAWLARYVIDRLPQHAFRSGSAVDATCGSGTFLVCFLERLVGESSKRGTLSSELLRKAVLGIDEDPVAIEAARLSLDFFCKAVGIESPQWNLQTKDATKFPVLGDWVIGNLPFGYRTHGGTRDISTVILENIQRTNNQVQALSLILPDSLAYTAGAEKTRELLRTNYELEEITRLPKAVFETSYARTIVVVGKRGTSGREVLVRDVQNRDLTNFRLGSYVSKTYVARFSPRLRDPWRFSPFNNEFERGELLGLRLGDLASIRMGLQIYGFESDVLTTKMVSGSKPLLMSPDDFARWTGREIRLLPRLKATEEQVRRPGPWHHFDEAKVIVRVTTSHGSPDRLAAIPDTQGIWFTDKFAGIWGKPDGLGVNEIAVYLQSRFARAWFDANNPSRKLRIKTIASMPVPKLPAEWWERASSLATSNTVVRASWPEEGQLTFGGTNIQEWNWFNSVVDSALGIDPAASSLVERWLSSERVA
jgi:hypothetical protein